MDIRTVIRDLEEIAPPAGAEEMDAGRIGLIIEGTPEIGRVVCALDATPAVIRESVRTGADMLVVHHTPLWSPVTSVSRPLGSFLKQVLAADLNVYVMHTNFDHARGGINDALAEVLGLTSVEEHDAWGLRRLQPRHPGTCQPSWFSAAHLGAGATPLQDRGCGREWV